MPDSEDTSPNITGMTSNIEVRLVHMHEQLKAIREDVKELIEAHNGRSKLAQTIVAAIANPSRNFLILIALFVLGTGAVSATQLLELFGMLPSVVIE